MTIEGDGSFQGVYQDSNMGDTGDAYPNGTVYQCSFQGRFSELEQVNEYTYKMQMAEMTYKNPVDREEVVDGVRYCYSAAYGLDGAEAVSYTHLDVYKRQIQCNAEADRLLEQPCPDTESADCLLYTSRCV